MKPDYWDRAKRALARNDPVMAAIIRSRPKVFLARRGEPFVTLSRAIVGQQISVKAAQSVWDKVCLCAGAVTPQSVLARKRSELRACGLSERDRKSTRLNSSHITISYAVFCLKKKKTNANRNDHSEHHTEPR